MLLATIDGSIVLIAMPEIFRGIHLDPLAPENSAYLLWMILGYLIVTSVLVVGLGRLGDMYGRVRMYSLGFAIYTVASLLLTINWLEGTAGANYLILFRVVQGVGAAFLMGNTPAILTDAFPANQRGFALGLNNVIGISGQFIGLVLGGLLAPINWRLIFLISVPFGLLGTVWSYRGLQERGMRVKASIDWVGNITFAGSLVLLMVAVTHGIRPYGGHPTGWTSPFVIGLIATAVVLMVVFVGWEMHVAHPMFRLSLFRIYPYTCGVLASFFTALARGGLMFMLIIWLQGIWLPTHGYDFSATPLAAGIHLIPLTVGIMIMGPIAGFLSDRYSQRYFTMGGALVSAFAFLCLAVVPIDFVYPLFGGLLFLMGLGFGAFASPNRAAVMNSLPPQHRGAGGGMNSTFQNSAAVLSIGFFFTLLIVGLSGSLSHALETGLVAHGVPPATAHHAAGLPPVSILLAAFLGYNPIQSLLGHHALAALPAASSADLTSRGFFPSLIGAPFHNGLREAFLFGCIACVIAAVASWSRGRRYVYGDDAAPVGELAAAHEPS
jgi:MFS family permease